MFSTLPGTQHSVSVIILPISALFLSPSVWFWSACTIITAFNFLNVCNSYIFLLAVSYLYTSSWTFWAFLNRQRNFKYNFWKFSPQAANRRVKIFYCRRKASLLLFVYTARTHTPAVRVLCRALSVSVFHETEQAALTMQSEKIEWCSCSVTKSCLTLVTLWSAVHQDPLSMGFPRWEYLSGLPFPSPGDLPNPGTEPRSPVLQADSLLSKPPGKPKRWAKRLRNKLNFSY